MQHTNNDSHFQASTSSSQAKDFTNIINKSIWEIDIMAKEFNTSPNNWIKLS